jgi:choline dehydrogenase-like flavoprotein
MDPRTRSGAGLLIRSGSRVRCRGPCGACVVGGCSAHNAGAVVFGSRLDYDGWATAGNPGWPARELLALFAAAWKQLRVRRVGAVS